MKQSLSIIATVIGTSLGLSSCGDKPEYHGAAITVAYKTVAGVKKKAITVINQQGQVLCTTGGLLEFPVVGQIQQTEEPFQQVDGNPLWQEGSHVGNIHRTTDGKYTEVHAIRGDTILRVVNQGGNGTNFPKNEQELEKQIKYCENSK